MTDDTIPNEQEEEVIDFGKKKKKEKKAKKEEDGSKADEAIMVETEFDEGAVVYTYEELLDRLHDIIESKNQQLNMRDKYTMKPPQITRVGAKKTGWMNFVEICNAMKRSPDHLSTYVFAELGCDGTFGGEGQFILKGRFYARNIESLLRRYIREYVMCSMCRSTNTELTKDQATRLHNLECKNCGAAR